MTGEKNKNAGRVRSATGPTAMYPGWKPSPEIAARWKKLTAPKVLTEEHIQEEFVNHATKTLARSAFNMDDFAAYQASAYSVRDQLIDQWNSTQMYHTTVSPKRVYYLSLEFLIGRSMDNALLNLGIKDRYANAIDKLGFNMEDLVEQETDAALGNGGLGRLAACFMDSLATLDYPAWGYGIRYNYGIFEQSIVDGYQTEHPDYWLTFGNPWEIQRLDITYPVAFGGTVIRSKGASGGFVYTWEPTERVVAVAHDFPIPGFGTKSTINIRLWSSKPSNEFDFASFNAGEYEKSVKEQTDAENITSCLYPNDNHYIGKKLRLKQQYFFVCATLQDIIRRFKKTGEPWSEFPKHVAIQLNDTHPTIGIVELQRILIDEEGLDWDSAWKTVTKVYSYTNHTVLPEALEKWTVPLLKELLPRHMMIIFDINLFFLQSVERRYPGDREKLRRMSIIEEGVPQSVRMAYLAVVCCHTVNGVAELHSDLVQKQLFSEFVEYFGADRFTNVTNGVTPRRWLHQANPRLSALITKTLKSQHWLKDLSELAKLKQFASDPEFQKKWMEIKASNKKRLAEHIAAHCNVYVNPDAIFDVQCKRIHEYKRQFMNILQVIHRYEELQKMTDEELAKQVPRVVIFAGKSAPGYYIAKLVIKLINNAANVINYNLRTSKYLQLVFIPNYNVSLAEIIIPASDISQHISTAGTEASGTSNMKFVLNGGLIVGTVDGANIEIGEETGPENIFLFGVLTPEVEDIRHKQTYGTGIKVDPKLDSVVESIRDGTYGQPAIFEPLLHIDTMRKVDACFQNKTEWAKKSILAAASMGKFSSDRSINDYAKNIWHISPLPPPE
ncbi:Non-essential glycogen phosphorylase [Boothiomyces sp. JEL0838]|nr:Non-essential glycogen phosphorylase [Boothiomyces sp. JEL0838]